MSNPAQVYENYMVPALFGPWATYLVQRANPQAGERVLDVGCGTGIVARQVAPLVGSSGKVVGIDINPAMLAVARAVAEQEGAAIEWHEGESEALPFPNNSFDVVLCQQMLQFSPDRPATVSEMHRVLNDGGRLVLSVWQGLDRHPFLKADHEATERRLGITSGQDPFSFGDADALRALLTDAGFQRIEIEPVSKTSRFPDPARFLSVLIDVATAAVHSMQHLDEKARQEMYTAIHEDMEGPLREATENGHVVLPFHAHVACAEKRSA